MVGHIIAPFWEDFADIIVRHTLCPRRPHPQTPHAPFWRFLQWFQHLQIQINLNYEALEPWSMTNTQEQSHASAVNVFLGV